MREHEARLRAFRAGVDSEIGSQQRNLTTEVTEFTEIEIGFG